MMTLDPLTTLAIEYARRVTEAGDDPDVTRAELAADVSGRFGTKGHRMADALRIFDSNTGHLPARPAAQPKRPYSSRRGGAKAAADKPHRTLEELGFVFLNTVTPEPIDWLWEPWIPRSMLAVLDGRPGAGKTTLLCDLAARVTRARAMPTEDVVPPGRKPGAVIFVTSENAFAQVLRPRLEAAGANLDRCLGWSTMHDEDGTHDCPRFPRDAEDLARVAREVGAVLIIVDPLFSHMDTELSPNRETDVRRALTPLARLAEETGAAVIAVRHFNKAANGDSINAGGGSIGIVGTARTQIVVGQPPEASPADPERVIAIGKTNNGKTPDALSFSIVEADVDGVPTSRIEWGGVSTATASDLTRAYVPGSGAPPVQEEVAEWLREALMSGPRFARELWEEASERGFAEATVKRAKKALGVKAEREGYGKDGGWVWTLPGYEAKGIGQSSLPDTVIPFEQQAPLCDSEADEGDDTTDSLNGDHAPGISEHLIPFEGDGTSQGLPQQHFIYHQGCPVLLDGRPATVWKVEDNGWMSVLPTGGKMVGLSASEHHRLAPQPTE